MSWYVTERTRLVVRQDDLVLLDLVQGTYGCLAGAGAALGELAEDGEAPQVDAELADLLAELCALSPTPPVHPGRWRPAALPGRDLMAAPPRRPTIREATALSVAWLSMARSFRGRSFGWILAHAQGDARHPPAEALSQRTRDLVAAFQACQPWIPFQGACLYRSFLLREALRRLGEPVWWVFGVQTWPFEAHCWLQVGDVVLDDWAERVGAYTPILAI